MKFLLAAALLFAIPAPAEADSGCGWEGNHINYDCANAYGSGAAGASAPLIGDSLEGNPAALPSQPSPFGLEGMWSNRASLPGQPGFSVNTVKGFDGMGFGIGSWSDGSFFAPDFDNHFIGTTSEEEFLNYQSHPPSTLGLRLGGVLVLPAKPLPKFLRISVGGSAGLGRVKGDWSPQAGVLVRIFGLGLGASNSYERISLLLPRVTVTTFAAGLQLGLFYLGYSRVIMKSSANTTNANVLGMRLAFPKWVFYGNIKSQLDHRGMPDVWHLGGVIRKLGRHIGVGYEYGEYRYSHSAILQIYL